MPETMEANQVISKPPAVASGIWGWLMVPIQKSHVVQHQLIFDHVDEAFFKGLFGPILYDEDADVKYINLGTTDNFVETETDTLIVRPCYEHLLPHIQNPIYQEKRLKCAVTGTPGIGKTMFGLYLLRHFLIEQKETVLYWARKKIFLFSFDDKVKQLFQLKDMSVPNNGETINVYCGKWDRCRPDLDWTEFTYKSESCNFIFIHDPDVHEHHVSDRKSDIPRLIFLLSHGHELISRWNAKGISMDYKYMATWASSEIDKCKRFLKIQVHCGKRKRGDFTVGDLDDVSVAYLRRRFGGCVRGWANDSLWGEIKSKIAEVVERHGDDVLKKTTSGRGSVIHLEVDFDKSRPIPQLVQKGSSLKELDSDHIDGDDEDSKSKPNDFSEFRYILGAEKIVEEFQERLLDRGQEYLQSCLTNWGGRDGFESVYGAVFELYCHRMLQRNNGKLELRMRIVYADRNKNNDTVYTVKLPQIKGTRRYPSNDPSILIKDQFESDVKTLGKYFLPISSNHPTYDSAYVVNGKDLGVDVLQADKVALLLQMTVSGATRLPRRPEHSVKQVTREKFENVFKQRIDDFNQNGRAYTAFMVPTACFMPFLFQHEKVGTGKKAVKQPDLQLVFEVPDVFVYKKFSPKSATSQREFTDRQIVHSFDEEKMRGIS